MEHHNVMFQYPITQQKILSMIELNYTLALMVFVVEKRRKTDNTTTIAAMAVESWDQSGLRLMFNVYLPFNFYKCLQT